MTAHPASPNVSGELEQWLGSEGDTSLGSLIEFFGQKSFALVFVLLLAVPALPLPTGGATHVFELVAVLLALQLIRRLNRGALPGGRCKRAFWPPLRG